MPCIGHAGSCGHRASPHQLQSQLAQEHTWPDPWGRPAEILLALYSFRNGSHFANYLNLNSLGLAYSLTPSLLSVMFFALEYINAFLALVFPLPTL